MAFTLEGALLLNCQMTCGSPPVPPLALCYVTQAPHIFAAAQQGISVARPSPPPPPGCQLSMESVAAAVQAAASDLAPSEGMRDFCTGAGEGLVLQALAPLLLQQGPGGKGLPAAAARLLQVRGWLLGRARACWGGL